MHHDHAHRRLGAAIHDIIRGGVLSVLLARPLQTRQARGGERDALAALDGGLPEQGQEGLDGGDGAEEVGVVVGVVDLADAGASAVGGRRLGLRDARVGHQDVDVAVRGRDGLDGGGDGGVGGHVDLARREVGDVEGHGGVGAEGLDGCFGFGQAAAANDDVIFAGRGQLLGGVVAQALAKEVQSLGDGWLIIADSEESIALGLTLLPPVMKMIDLLMMDLF